MILDCPALGHLGTFSGIPDWRSGSMITVTLSAKLIFPVPLRSFTMRSLEKRQADRSGRAPGDSCSNACFVNSRGQVVGTSEDQYLRRCCGRTRHHSCWPYRLTVINWRLQITQWIATCG